MFKFNSLHPSSPYKSDYHYLYKIKVQLIIGLMLLVMNACTTTPESTPESTSAPITDKQPEIDLSNQALSLEIKERRYGDTLKKVIPSYDYFYQMVNIQDDDNIFTSSEFQNTLEEIKEIDQELAKDLEDREKVDSLLWEQTSLLKKAYTYQRAYETMVFFEKKQESSEIVDYEREKPDHKRSKEFLLKAASALINLNSSSKTNIPPLERDLELLRILTRLKDKRLTTYYNDFILRYKLDNETKEELNFILAEYYFDQNQLKKALSHYQKNSKNSSSSYLFYSMYKIAWIQLKEYMDKGKKNYPYKAESAFKLTAKAMQTAQKRDFPYQDILFDFGLVKGDIGDMGEAKKAFDELSEPKAYSLCLFNFGKKLFRAQNYDKSQKIFQKLLDEDPTPANLYEIYSYILPVFFQKKQYRDLLEHIIILKINLIPKVISTVNIKMTLGIGKDQ